MSIPGWLPMLQPLLRPGATLTWLPVPSAIPVRIHPEATASIRARYGNGRQLVGHFGTYGGAISALLDRTLQDLAVMSDCHILLLGDKSDVACRTLLAAQPSLAGRLFATGHLAAQDAFASCGGLRSDAPALPRRHQQPSHQRDGRALARSRHRDDRGVADRADVGRGGCRHPRASRRSPRAGRRRGDHPVRCQSAGSGRQACGGALRRALSPSPSVAALRSLHAV